jgi:aspartyl-tRNA(Asn)/glutamyl-tRNA(Gln) amidotransferase subunit C
MPALSPDDVRHIAKLARLQLQDGEVEKYTKELSSILAYVAQLQEVDTRSVEPTAHVTGLANVLRADRICAPACAPESLLGLSPLPIIDRQIKTPSAHGPTTRETAGF